MGRPKLYPDVEAPCLICGKLVTTSDSSQRVLFAQTGRVYCCEEHSRIGRGRNISMAMKGKPQPHSSARMQKNNPMKMPGVRDRAREALIALGHKPPVQGGNGRGVTECEELLLSTLQKKEPRWVGHFVLPTRQFIPGYLPAHYKIDLALPALLLAIEVDGMSHNTLARQEQDRRKGQFLIGAGWTVLRFTNGEVRQSLSRCAETVMCTTSKLKNGTLTLPRG